MNDSPSMTSRRADGGAVVFALALPTAVTWVYFVLLADSPPALQQMAYGIGKVVQFGFPLFWVLAVQRRPLGLSLPGLRGIGTGVAFGGLVLVAMMVLYHAWLKPIGYLDATSNAGREIYDKVAGFGLDSLGKYIALGAFYALFHSLLEEYYWRWFVFGQLRRLVSVRMAILISSLGFMAHHVLVLGTYFGQFSAATVVFSLSVAVGGAVWAWLYQRSQSLYAPWASHLVVDAAIFIVGYDLVRHLFTS